MKRLMIAAACTCLAAWLAPTATAQTDQRPYRLNAVDLKQQVIWGAECRLASGQGLAFGGQDQDADDGRPHTRQLIDNQWQAIHHDLRAANSLQPFHAQTWSLRQDAKHALARARSIFFEGLPPSAQTQRLAGEVLPRLQSLADDLAALQAALPDNVADPYSRDQAQRVRARLRAAAEQLKSTTAALAGPLHAVALIQLLAIQQQLERAAESLDAEPPARAMQCGAARLSSEASGPVGETLVYDAQTQRYVLFGGDHLDYLTNDTWVFDPAQSRWYQCHPAAAPPPRANHRLTAPGDGTIRLTGGYTYASNTDYVGGQYLDLNDGIWTYHIAKNQWTGGADSQLVAADARVYRTGPFHPEFYYQGERPDAAEFQSWLQAIPVNQWVPTDPPHRPRLNRDWGTARIDPGRDMMLRWSGGHSAHGGTDVLHYHFATNRWELPIPVEFPLGQLYSNTSYPNGFNFNLRPWMTGHTYQNYDYDPPSRMMIKAGRPRHFYIYDPDVGDWIGRGKKPAAMQYNSCFYTLTLTATPRGVVCWDKNGRVHRYDHQDGGRWIELELRGDPLPGAYVDNSSIAYDSKRDRVLMVNTLGYGKPFDGQVWSLELATGQVTALEPAGREHAHRFANVDKCCYDAGADLLLLGTYLRQEESATAGEPHTPTPAYDCRHNRWVTLKLGYSTGERNGNPTRAFPHRRSDGLMYDAGRQLIWGTDTNSQVYVLRLDLETAELQPLK